MRHTGRWRGSASRAPSRGRSGRPGWVSPSGRCLAATPWPGRTGPDPHRSPGRATPPRSRGWDPAAGDGPGDAGLEDGEGRLVGGPFGVGEGGELLEGLAAGEPADEPARSRVAATIAI